MPFHQKELKCLLRIQLARGIFLTHPQITARALSKERFIFLWIEIQIFSYLNDSNEELAKDLEIKVKLYSSSSSSLFGACNAFGVNRYIFNQK